MTNDLNVGDSRFRPLRPAAIVRSDGASSEGATAPAPPISMPKKRQNVSVACVACRKRKTKCDGQPPPCSLCRKRQTACTYPDSLNDLPHQVLKRKYVESQSKIENFEEFLSLLKTRSEMEAIEICRRVRSGLDVKTVVSLVQDGDLLTQMHLHPDTSFQYTFPFLKHMPAFLYQQDNVYMNTQLYRSIVSHQERDTTSKAVASHGQDMQYVVPYHAAELVDAQVGSVKLSKWTAVAKDDAFLTQLLQSYFLLEFPFFPFFHKDYFLEDLVAGRQQFCSSLLVNAILAAACHCYNKVQDRAEFWNPSTVGYQFLGECRRLWELEAGNSSLTTIQAATVLALTHNKNGMDKIGWSYMIQAIRAAESIDLFGEVQNAHSTRLKTARTFTAWGLFNFQAYSCFHLFKGPVVKHPPMTPLPNPATNAKWYGELWLRYPSDPRLLPMGLSYTFKASADFRVILNDMAWQAFAEGRSGLAYTEALQYQERLNTWYDDLPQQLSAGMIVLPFHLELHMHYFNALIYIFEAFSSCDPSDESSQKRTKAAQDVVAFAKIRLETLVRLCYVHHGFDAYDVFLLQFLMFLGFMHIKSLATSAVVELNDAYRSTVYLVAKGLRDQGRCYYLAEVVFRMMRAAMSSSDQQYLDTITNIRPDEDQTRSLISRHTLSVWPINIISINENPESHRLGELVKIADELELEKAPTDSRSLD